MSSPLKLVMSVLACATSLIACNHETAYSNGPVVPAHANGTAPPLGPRDIGAARGTRITVASAAAQTAQSGVSTSLAPPEPPGSVMPIAVIRVNTFNHKGDKSAVILRRHSAWPHNVIVLDDQHMTLQFFGAAMKALSHEVQKAGEIPTTDQMIEVHGAQIPPSWRSGMQKIAQWELDTLKTIPLSNVEGVGDAPAILIHMLYTKPGSGSK